MEESWCSVDNAAISLTVSVLSVTLSLHYEGVAKRYETEKATTMDWQRWSLTDSSSARPVMRFGYARSVLSIHNIK